MRRPASALLLLAAILPFHLAPLGAYVYDDLSLVVRNGALRSFDLGALLTAPLFGDDSHYWRPLTMLALALGNQLGGAAGVHLLALALHATNAWLAFRLLGRWLPAGVAWLAALLFAWHPVQVEAVAWCAAINDPLWVGCALAAMLVAARAPLAAAALLLAALLAKENAIAAAPLVWLAARESGSAAGRRAAVGAAAAVLAWWLLRALVFGSWHGALLPDAPPLRAADLLVPADLLLRHLALLVWPAGLTPFHAYHGSLARQLAALVAVAGAALLLAGNWRRLPPAVRFGSLLLLCPLLPTLVVWRAIGAHPIGERYLYLSCLGLALLLGHALRRGRARIGLLLLALLWAPLAFVQVSTWHDDQRLLDRGLRLAPDDPKLQVMAGDLALQRAEDGDAAARAAAEQHYRRAEQLAVAQGAAAERQLGEARLGSAWCFSLAHQDPAHAAERTARFRAVVDAWPDNAAAWVGLGVAHGMAGAPAAAEQALRQALRIDPHNGEGWFNLSLLLLQTGRRPEARAALQQALRCNPDDPRAAALLRQAGGANR